MSLEIQADIIVQNGQLRGHHPYSERTPPRGEPGQAYQAIRGPTDLEAALAQIMQALGSELTSAGTPLETRARVALERCFRSGWLTLSADGTTVTVTPPKSLTGQF